MSTYIKVDQNMVDVITNALAQRPYGEVHAVMRELEIQLSSEGQEKIKSEILGENAD